MGFFDRAKSSPHIPGFSLEDNPKPDTARTEEQVRSMAGFASPSEVAAAAPSSTSAPEIAIPSKRGRPASRYATVATPVGPTAAEIAAEQKKLEALNTIGRASMKEIAALPYEVWAFMASDPELRLSPEEQKELAEAYFVVAQSIKPDFTKLKWCLAFVAFTNLKLVIVRMKSQMEKKKSPEKLADLAERGDAVLPN